MVVGQTHQKYLCRRNTGHIINLINYLPTEFIDQTLIKSTSSSIILSRLILIEVWQVGSFSTGVTTTMAVARQYSLYIATESGVIFGPLGNDNPPEYARFLPLVGPGSDW